MTYNTTIKAEFIAPRNLFDFAANMRRYSEGKYNKVSDLMVYDAWISAKRQNLRYNRKTNIMLDDRLGVIERPVDSDGMPTCSRDEAQSNLMREIWGAACADYNCAMM